MTLALCQQSQNTSHCAKHDKRNLFKHGSQPCVAIFWTEAKSPKWPEIHKQEYARQCHHHRFAHESEDEQKQTGRIRNQAASPVALMQFDIPNVRPKAKQPKQSTEDVFALGHPGNRFDMKRLPGKQSSDH